MRCALTPVPTKAVLAAEVLVLMTAELVLTAALLVLMPAALVLMLLDWAESST